MNRKKCKKMSKTPLINTDKCDKVKNVLVTINVEVCVATEDVCVKRDVGLKNKIMNNRNVNLMQLANYLIQMFYKTEQKYSCTRTKIGKMLSIAAFVFARKGELLFDEFIYKYDDCGTAINELKVNIDRDVYIQYEYADDKQRIEKAFDYNTVIPQNYAETEDIPEDVKKEIENIFREFGAYSAYELGQLINPIVNHKDIITEDNRIDLSKIKLLKSTDLEVIEEFDKLIKYLFV